MRVWGPLAALLMAGVPLLAGPLPSQDDWAGARQSVTTADGQQLSYVEVDGTDGVVDDPLILLHGYTDNSRSWSLLVPHLGGRHVYAVDLRGHGGSDAPACCYGIDAFSGDLLGFMDALGIDRADIVGHSLGSMTAGVFAAEHPDRVDHLVLVSTAFSVPKGPTDWLWDNVPALTPPIDPNSQFMLDWYANPTPVDDDFLSRERAESAAVPLHVWTGVLRALTMTDWSWYARRIESPVLVLWGDQDGLFDAGTQDWVRDTLPEAEFETYAGHGHNMFWERPEDVGARIVAFLGE
ncbi:alpha/beta hydrolase [Rubellimicrobium rubrum]|uniref:Alpha/beta hydrolase n=1 Tax=Rubellimicrobium rubrum TaxID=2585369 RepID=A0A5C4N5D8_9RHOB|nr:alpha/beta hydrolase [Rubellimicrobium rubrum]TNC51859.1 alpha/beta hydrolase [Rubellimicrobium rubrum]